MCYPFPLSYVGLTWGLVLGYAIVMGDELDALLLNPPDLPSDRQSRLVKRKTGAALPRKSANPSTPSSSSFSRWEWISTSFSVIVSSASSIIFFCWYRKVLPFVRTVPLFPLLQRLVPQRYRVLVLLSILGSSGILIATILHRFVVRQLLKYTNWYLETPNVVLENSEKNNPARSESTPPTIKHMYLRSPTSFYWFPVAKVVNQRNDAGTTSSVQPFSKRAITGYPVRTRIWSFLSSVFLHRSIPCTEVYERCLPKQPVPSLAHTVQAYLEASQPLYWTSSGFSAATSDEAPALITANAAKWLKEDEERERQERSCANPTEGTTGGHTESLGNLSFGAPTPFGNSPAAKNPEFLPGQREEHLPLASGVVSSEWRQLCRLAAKFLIYEGPLLQKQLKSLHRPWWTALPWLSASSSSPAAYHADANYVTEWWKRSIYLAARHPLPFTTNYTVNLFKNYTPTTHAISRAAVLTYLMGQLQTQIKDRRVPPVFSGPEANIPVSMEQLFLAFYTTRIPGRAVDILEHYKESENFHNPSSTGYRDSTKKNIGCYFPSARYVIVIYKGFMYQMFLEHPSKNTSNNTFLSAINEFHENSKKTNTMLQAEEEEEEDTMISTEASLIREANAQLAKKHAMASCTPRMLERSLEWIVQDVEMKERHSERRQFTNTRDVDQQKVTNTSSVFHHSSDINKSFPPRYQCPALVSLLRHLTEHRKGLSTLVESAKEGRRRPNESAFYATVSTQPTNYKDEVNSGGHHRHHRQSLHPESPFASFLLPSNDPHALAKEEQHEEAQRFLPALTCVPRALWSDTREQYLVQDPVNCFPLKVVEQAMFVVSLDSLDRSKEPSRSAKRSINHNENHTERHPSGHDEVADISVSPLRSSYTCSSSTGDEDENEDLHNQTHIFPQNSTTPQLSKSPVSAFEPLFSEPLGRCSADEMLLSSMNAPRIIEGEPSEDVRLSDQPHNSNPQIVPSVPPEIEDEDFDEADEHAGASEQVEQEKKQGEGEAVGALQIDVNPRRVILPCRRSHRKKSENLTPSEAQDVFLSLQGRGISMDSCYPHLWADKSIHLLVDRNGNAGFHVEASWGDPAVFQWIADYVGAMELKSSLRKDREDNEHSNSEGGESNAFSSPLSAMERSHRPTSPLHYYTSQGYAARLEGDEPDNPLPFGIPHSELFPGKRRPRGTNGNAQHVLEGSHDHHSPPPKGSWWKKVFFSTSTMQDSLPTLLTPCRLSFRMHQPLVSAIHRAHYAYTNLNCSRRDEDDPHSHRVNAKRSTEPGGGNAATSPEEEEVQGTRFLDVDLSPLSPPSSQLSSSPPPIQVFTLSFCDYGRSFIEKALASVQALSASSILRSLYASDSEKALGSIGGEPGAWVLLAVQLAYHETKGQLSQIYETLPLLSFRQGRSESIRCLSGESVRCISALRSVDHPMQMPPQKPSVLLHLIRLACARYTKKRQLARVGQGSERHLFGLFLMRSRSQIPSEFLSRVLRHLRWKVHCREHLPSLSSLQRSEDDNPSDLVNREPHYTDHHSVAEKPNARGNSKEMTPFSQCDYIESGLLTVPPLSTDGYGVSFCFQQGGLRKHISASEQANTDSSERMIDPFSVPLPAPTAIETNRNRVERTTPPPSSVVQESIDVVITCYRSVTSNQGPPTTSKAFACCVQKWLKIMGQIVRDVTAEEECRHQGVST